MKDFKRTLVTTALPYANGPVHIGHLAGVYVPADIYVRYLRMCQEDVLLIGGSDEHGVPITIRAKKEGVTPQEVVDRYHELIKSSFQEFGISFDIYSRTSSKVHHEMASEFFKTLYEKGIFEEKVSQQLYDAEAKQFLADRYVVGTCPVCNTEGAYGDQCEKCGSSLNATELKNPVSALTGNTPELKETKHWYLPLNNYQEFFEQWILSEHKEWRSNVYGQCKSWLDAGLHPRAVTRDLDWGVPLPIKEGEGKVLYVWFDAPIGYISATKELTPEWEKYWKSEESRLVHFIGKDNIVFHCIIFPAMLKAEGSYVLPDNVPSNEFLNLEGDKISTSRNWAVWLHEYLKEFPGQQDTLRYVLTANAPETKDNDFTWNDFQARNNNELVAVLGNFVNRALVLTHKYFGGKVPGVTTLTDTDKEVLAELPVLTDEVAKQISTYHFREGLKTMMNIARLGNKYLAETEPWKLWKTNPERVATILNTALQIVANLSMTMEPFLPFAGKKMREMIAVDIISWNELHELRLAEGHQLEEVSLLFAKIEDDVIEEQIKKLAANKKENESANEKTALPPVKAEIDYETFLKMDLRIGTIKTAERVPKTEKLLKLTIDIGTEERTVVSGIAKDYKPEDVIGTQVSLLVNLAPRKIRGILSQGMILMAENTNGELAFVSPDKVIDSGRGIY